MCFGIYKVFGGRNKDESIFVWKVCRHESTWRFLFFFWLGFRKCWRHEWRLIKAEPGSMLKRRVLHPQNCSFCLVCNCLKEKLPPGGSSDILSTISHPPFSRFPCYHHYTIQYDGLALPRAKQGRASMAAMPQVS